MFAGKKSAQIREILISESAWEEMTCLFAPSLIVLLCKECENITLLLYRIKMLIAYKKDLREKIILSFFKEGIIVISQKGGFRLKVVCWRMNIV